MKQISITLLVICLLLVSSVLIIEAQNQNQSQKQTPTFRYVIAHNKINKLSEKSNIPNRNLIILMEKNAFQRENLKRLYVLLNKRFPTPANLIIVVSTNISDIPTPEEMETGTFGKIKSETPWAIMFRLKKVSRIDAYTDDENFSIEMP